MSTRVALFTFTGLLALATACSEDSEGLDGGGGGTDSGADAGMLARGITIETVRLDIGGVVVTSTDTATFTLTNDNADPVKVTVTPPMGGRADRFSRSLDIADEGGRFEVPAGGTVTVSVTVSPSEIGPLGTNLLVESCLGECPVLVEVVARGIESGISCTTPLDFGLVFPGTCATRPVVCENVGNAEEGFSSVGLVEDGGGVFTGSPINFPPSFPPGATLEIPIEFCPGAAEPSTGTVEVLTAGAFPTTQIVELLGRGGGPRLSCGPESIDFGQVGVGGLGRAAFTCFNDGFDSAQLELGLATGAQFMLGATTASIAPGTSQVVEVTVAPAGEGAVQDTLTVSTNDGATPMLSVALSAQGVMVGPCTFEAVPSELDFGIVNEGDLHAAPIRVRNTGSDDCLLGEAVITAGGEHFAVRGLPSRGAVLAPNETASFEVTFAPRTAALLEGAVDVTVQNTGTGRQPVVLRGQGGPAGLVPEPVALDFGSVPTICSAPITRTVTLRRVSSTPSAVGNVRVESGAPDVFTLVSEVSSTQLGFYETLSFEVGFQPTADGVYTGEVRVFFGLPSPVIIPLSGEARTVGARSDTVTVSAPKIDLLFVVDDSGGNTAVQAGLAASISDFATRLLDRQADVHFGVVTTDMVEPNRGGRLIGSPAFLDGNSSDLAAELAARMEPGTEGSGTERGLAASLAALTPPLSIQDNVGFRRLDADLGIIYISSEDDQSAAGVTPQVLLETFRGLTRGRRLFIAGIVGPPAGECDGPSGSAVNSERYSILIGRAENGQLLPYCAPAADNLAAIADRLLGTNVTLTGAPVIDQLAVRIGGVDVPATAGANRNWAYDLAGNRVVFFDATITNGDVIEVSYPLQCVPGTCGDMVTDTGEFCDDGNDVSTDACIDCRNAVCGDGIAWAGTEECDDGNLFDDDACLTTCVAAVCGDGIVQAGVESCDDGNTVSGDGCPATCRFYQSSGLAEHSFAELSNGSPLTFSDNDDGRTSVTLPFTFEIGGVPTSSLAVSVNGFVSTQSIDPASSFTNLPIPSSEVPNGMIAVWWDDLVLDDSIPGGAATSTATLGLPPNRQYVIEWRDLRSADHNSNNHRRWTFQLVLEETSNVVRFRYADTETRGRVPTAVTASSGIEDEAGALGIEALGCSPGCSGPQRQGNRPNGFPEQTEVVLTP